MQEKLRSNEVMTSGPRYAEKFELLLEYCRHTSGERQGQKWRGVEIERETNGDVTGGYVTGVRKGRIVRPGWDKLEAVADVMGFPFEYWKMDPKDLRRELEAKRDSSETAAPKYEGVVDLPDAGGPQRRASGKTLAALVEDQIGLAVLAGRRDLTDAEGIAAATGHRITRRDVEAMRSGEARRLTEGQALALSDAFEVDLSHWHEGSLRDDLINPAIAERLVGDGNVLVLHRPGGWSGGQKTIVRAVADNLKEEPAT